jgi:hypothetical protein
MIFLPHSSLPPKRRAQHSEVAFGIRVASVVVYKQKFKLALCHVHELSKFNGIVSRQLSLGDDLPALAYKVEHRDLLLKRRGLYEGGAGH